MDEQRITPTDTPLAADRGVIRQLADPMERHGILIPTDERLSRTGLAKSPPRFAGGL